jgi:hypothetical protein
MEDNRSFCEMLELLTIAAYWWICLKCLKKSFETKSLYLSIVV